jgi:hypothetical protein
MHDKTKRVDEKCKCKKELVKRVSNVWKRLLMLFLNNDNKSLYER